MRSALATGMRLFAALGLLLATTAVAAAAVEPALQRSRCLGLWPQPKHLAVVGNGSRAIDPAVFQIKLNSAVEQTNVIKSTIERYKRLILQKVPESKEIVYPESIRQIEPPSGAITELIVNVVDSTTGSTKINLGIDESYKLEVMSDRHSVYLTSQTWVGMLRGLETFSQLVQPIGYDLAVTCVPIVIEDAPRFPWRGLLLDTSRHFHPVWSIKRVLDAMSYNKLNVFHWHLIDAEAFPLVLKSHPELAAKGAWNVDSVYTASDVTEVIQYAFSRGIRVVPEVDTPGHTYSWRHADPKIILNCAKLVTRPAYPGINSIAFDMTYENTYNVLKDVYSEVATLFSDSYLHVGGDEVIAHCLDEFPRIIQWMKENLNGSTDYKDLIRYFRFRLSPMVTGAKKKMIVWQEAFEEMLGQRNNPLFPNNTIVQVWKNENFTDAVRASLSSKFPTLVSSGWYLDQQIPSPEKALRYLYEDTWKDFYAIEPLAGVDDVPGAADLMLGGEVCQWGENINAFNIDGNMWTRGSAAAERLWSPREQTDANEAYWRLASFQCHLNRRGIAATPLRPNSCPSPLLESLYMGTNAPPVAASNTAPSAVVPQKISFSLAAFLMGVVGSLIVGLAVGGIGAFWLARRTSRTSPEGFSVLENEPAHE